MENKNINRLKAVLAEQNVTSKWLCEQLQKDPATVSMVYEYGSAIIGYSIADSKFA